MSTSQAQQHSSSSLGPSDQADDLAYASPTAQNSSIDQVALPVREKRSSLSLDTTDGSSGEGSVTCPSPKDLSPTLVLRISNEFTPIIDKQGDTLIYIGPPAKTKDQPHSEYLHIERHFNRFYLVGSSKLKALNSSKIDLLLRPKACIFAAKRFKTLDAYQDLSQEIKDAAKYYVDLRPAQMEDEAVMLLTELSCSKGICNWYLAHDYYSVPNTVVMGTDFLDTESNPYYNILDMSAKQNFVLDLSPVAEYSALRHHSGLERLIHAAYSQDPKLDSAPKMWTFFSLALFFDCADHPLINQWVSAWLKKRGNNNFIQNNPEVAFRIGMGIKDANLVRVAFSILVGEMALMLVCNEGEIAIAPRHQSIHGRMLENLDDDEQNRIDHAASSLVSRMRSFFNSVFNDLDWMLASTEYQKLLTAKADSDASESAIHQADTLLKAYVKGRCLTILHRRLQELSPDLEKEPQQAAPFRHGLVPCFEGLYSNLQPNARLFTRSFWMVLSKCRFGSGFANTDVTHMTQLMIPSYLDDVTCVTREALDTAINTLNQALSHQDDEPEPSAFGLWDSHGQHQQQYLYLNTHMPSSSSPQPPLRSSPTLPPCTDEPLMHSPPPPPPPPQQKQQQHDNPSTTTDGPQPSLFNYSYNYNYKKPSYQPICTSVLLNDLSTALALHICDPMIYPNHLFNTDDSVPVNLIDHLLNLDESEWKFLPLWAGGLDDGSGGVFANQDIPDGPISPRGSGSRSSHHDPYNGPREKEEEEEGWLFQGGKRGISRSRMVYHDDNDNDGDGDGDGTASFDWISTDEGVDSVCKASRVAVATTAATVMTDSTLSGAAVVVVGRGRPTETVASVRSMSDADGDGDDGDDYDGSYDKRIGRDRGRDWDWDRGTDYKGKGKGKMKEEEDTMTDTVIIGRVADDIDNSGYNRNKDDDNDGDHDVDEKGDDNDDTLSDMDFDMDMDMGTDMDLEIIDRKDNTL